MEKTAKCVRLRIVRPVFEDLIISECNKHYFTGGSLKSSQDIYQIFSYLSKETREHFIAVHLSTKNEIICVDTISIGSLTASVVHPREVFKSALLSSAASVAFVHNHPSGSPDPSKEDLDITAKLNEAGKLLGISVLDHVIIGSGGYISLMEKNYL